MTNAKLQLESADDDDAKKPPRKTALDFCGDDDSPLELKGFAQEIWIRFVSNGPNQ